jgi:hypothetical protein
MFASGTDSAPGGWSIVGEQGPELMNVPKGAQILPNGRAPGGGGGGQSGPVQVVVSVDNNGNLQAYVKNIAQGTSQRTVTAALDHPSFTDRVAGATKQASTRRLGR